MVEIVLLLKFPDVLPDDFKVIGIVFLLWSIEPELLGHVRLVVYTNIEEYRDNVELHVLNQTLVIFQNGVSCDSGGYQPNNAISAVSATHRYFDLEFK